MPKLPQISGNKLTRAFLKDGWIKVSQRGSHLKLRKYHKPIGQTTIIIPMHKVIKKGTLAAILKDSYLSLNKLKKLL